MSEISTSTLRVLGKNLRLGRCMARKGLEEGGMDWGIAISSRGEVEKWMEASEELR